MANWKKVIVSGSNAELNQVTASFFKGDGSALTNVMAGSVNLESFPDGTGITVATTDKLLVSDAGIEKYINVSQLPFTVNTNTQNTAAEIRTKIGSGNNGHVPTIGTSGHFLKHDGTFGLPSYTTNTDTQNTAAEIRTKIGSGNDGHVPSVGTSGHFLKHDGTFGLPSYTTNTDTNTQNTAAEIRTKIGSGNNGHVPTIGSAGQFLKHDGTFGTPSYTTNTNTQNTAAEIRTKIGSGNNGHVPTTGTAGHFLKHDGTFGLPSYTTNTDTQLTATEVRANLSGTGLIGYDNSTGVISTTANNYVHPTGAGNKHIPTGGASGQFLRYTSSGTAVWATPGYTTNTDVNVSVANLKTALAGGFGSNAVQIGDSSDVVTIGNKLVVTGDLTVSGTTTTVDTANLNVTDQFINLNDGGSANDGGLVVEGAGTSFGWDNSEGRWAFDALGATANQTSITSDAFAAAVVTSDNIKYRKNGNIRVEADEIYIYTE